MEKRGLYSRDWQSLPGLQILPKISLRWVGVGVLSKNPVGLGWGETWIFPIGFGKTYFVNLMAPGLKIGFNNTYKIFTVVDLVVSQIFDR